MTCVIASCGVENYVTIADNHAATIVFDKDSTKILVVNTFNFDRLNLKSAKKLDVVKGGAYASINYAASRLKQLKGVSIIYIPDSNHTATSVDSLSMLAARYHADYILALNNFQAYFDADNIQSHDSNTGKKDAYKTADFSIKLTANYILYDKNASVYKQLNGFVSDFQSTEEVPNALLAGLVGPGIKGNSQVVNQSAIHATDVALQGFFAYTSTRSRSLYNNDDLHAAVEEITANNFDKADSLLRPFLANEDTGLAAKAAYDLAVVYEAKGNFKVAVEMAQLSVEKENNSKARILLGDLNTTIAAVP